MNKILSFFKKDIFIFILVVVAVGFYFRKKTKSLSKQNYALYREYFVLQDEQKILNEYKKMEWKSNGLVLDDIVFEDKKSSSHFYEIVNLPTLIFYFNKYACPPCVNKYIEILNSLGKEGKMNIIGIYNSESIIDYEILLRDNKFNFKLYYCNDNLMSTLDTDSDSPYFIIVDTGYKVHDARIGIPNDSIANPYFEMLQRKWFNESASY